MDDNKAFSYRVLLEGGEGEIVEKKSRFIATIRCVESEEEAVAFILQTSEAYRDKLPYWYMYAAHGFARPLIGLVSPEFAGRMRRWYHDHNPRPDRMPVQQEVFELLKKRERA